MIKSKEFAATVRRALCSISLLSSLFLILPVPFQVAAAATPGQRYEQVAWAQPTDGLPTVQVLNDQTLSGIRGRGLAGASQQADQQVGIVLWDEPGRGSGGSKGISQSVGMNNTLTNSVTLH